MSAACLSPTYSEHHPQLSRAQGQVMVSALSRFWSSDFPPIPKVTLGSPRAAKPTGESDQGQPWHTVRGLLLKCRCCPSPQLLPTTAGTWATTPLPACGFRTTETSSPDSVLLFLGREARSAGVCSFHFAALGSSESSRAGIAHGGKNPHKREGV